MKLWHVRLIKVQERNGGSIRRPPKSRRSAKDFLFVDPIRDTVKDAGRSIKRDLTTIFKILVDMEVVVLNISKTVTYRTPSDMLNAWSSCGFDQG